MGSVRVLSPLQWLLLVVGCQPISFSVGVKIDACCSINARCAAHVLSAMPSIITYKLYNVMYVFLVVFFYYHLIIPSINVASCYSLSKLFIVVSFEHDFLWQSLPSIVTSSYNHPQITYSDIDAYNPAACICTTASDKTLINSWYDLHAYTTVAFLYSFRNGRNGMLLL